MSYKWEKANTPEGLDRLKELIDNGIQLSTKSGDGSIYECFRQPDGCIFIDGCEYDDWADAENEDAFSHIEFLDPDPQPKPDENGLLPCPFCGGKAELLTYSEGQFNGFQIRCPDISCHAYKNTQPINYWPMAQLERQTAKWNKKA